MLPKVKHNTQFRGKAQCYAHGITSQFNEEEFADIDIKCSKIAEEKFLEMPRGISLSFPLTNSTIGIKKVAIS